MSVGNCTLSYPAALYRDATWYRHAILNNHIHPGRVAGMFRERKKDSDDSSVVRTTKQELAMAKYIEGYSNKIQQAVIANPEIYNHMRNVFFDIVRILKEKKPTTKTIPRDCAQTSPHCNRRWTRFNQWH